MEQRQSEDSTPDSLVPLPNPSVDIEATQPTASAPVEPTAQPAPVENTPANPREGGRRGQPRREFTQGDNNGRDNRQNGRHDMVQKDSRPQRDNGRRSDDTRDQQTRETNQRPAQNQRTGDRQANRERDANSQESRNREQASQARETDKQEPRNREQTSQTRETDKQEPRNREQSGRDRENGNPENRQREQTNRERDTERQDNRQRESRQRDASVNESDDQASRADRDGGQPGDNRLVIGISMGDYNGIGPEVILKALQYNRLQKLCTPVIYGSMRIMNRYRNLLDMKDWNLNGAPSISQISHKMTNVITCWPDQQQEIQPGQVTPEAGQAAFACLQRAVDDLKEGKIDALVTAPINKYNIQSEEFKFPGHTEYLAEQFGVADNLMFMVSEQLRVGVVTGHVPLGRVRQNVTRERILQKLNLMMQSLKQDFGIEKPKIAVLGLNPHAGEEGLLGNEEQDIIKPLLNDLRNKGQLVFGPYPADGFFGTRSYGKFDAVLAMYHDQGLIPFKSIAFEEGVNFTAGMPAVRTSPDHGTAYDIAGKNLADETSMMQAIYTAIDVARQRKEYAELAANALK